jgi:dihydrolipoamide dehydrogenase
MSLIEVKVPDIGDFSGVDVIEVNIKPGDVIEKEQTLLTLESDKASMEVPSDIAGTVKEIKVKAGDKVSQGTVIALVEASAGAAAPAPAPRKHPTRRSPQRLRRLRPLPPRHPRRKPAATAAQPTSNATCSCSAPAPAATRPRSAPPTSA